MSVSPRSSIDNLTAVTRLPLLDDSEELRRLVAGAPPTDSHLLSFLHEATHHWCLSSLVGNVIAGLGVRAGSAALRLYFERADLDTEGLLRLSDETVHFAARYETALELLRPLAEGMALFAEFDAFSGRRSTAVTDPYKSATNIFCAPGSGPTGAADARRRFEAGEISSAEHADAVFLAMATLLINVRARDEAVDRKASLLLQPLDPEVGGGYLSGYLAVKRLWWECARRANRLYEETDLFLAFLQSYIYWDVVLAGLLLGGAEEPPQLTLTRWATRLQNRLAELPQVVNDQLLDEFERALVDETTWTARRSATIGVDQTEHEAAFAVITDFERRFSEAEQDGDPLPMLASMLLTQRRFLSLGRLTTDVSIEGDLGSIPGSNGSRIEFSVRRRPEAPQHGDGLHLVSPVVRDWSPVCVVVEAGEEAIAVGWTSWSPDTIAELTELVLGDRPTYADSLQYADAVRALIRGSIEIAPSRPVLADMAGAMPTALRDIYLPFALAGLDDAAAEAHRGAMARFGLRSYLGGSEATQNLARLGLITSVKNDLSQVRHFYGLLGVDLDETVSQIRSASEQTTLVRVFLETFGELGFVACMP